MPVYCYECKDTDCNNYFEEVQSIKDEELVTCPKCGKDTLKKVMGQACVQFKGGGFYCTDN